MVNYWAFAREVGVARWAWRYGMRQVTKRLLRTDNRLKLRTGLTITLPRDNSHASEVYVTGGALDWGSDAIFARFAQADRDFLDIGAHIGYYSIYLSPLVRNVYAFEPNPAVLPDLRRNADQASNIEVVPLAVSSTNGVVRFDATAGPASRIADVPGAIAVEATTVDAFVERTGVEPCVIKTDCEHHDIEALVGADRTVRRFQPLILSEYGMTSPFARLLESWHYCAFAITREPHTLRRRFISVSEGEYPPTKMLFLVPRRLLPEFQALVAADK